MLQMSSLYPYTIALAAILLTISVVATQHNTPPEIFVASMETTMRPAYTESDKEAYSPIPLTPDLGNIANSVATQPSAANVMRAAKINWENVPTPTDAEHRRPGKREL